MGRKIQYDSGFEGYDLLKTYKLYFNLELCWIESDGTKTNISKMPLSQLIEIKNRCALRGEGNWLKLIQHELYNVRRYNSVKNLKTKRL